MPKSKINHRSGVIPGPRGISTIFALLIIIVMSLAILTTLINFISIQSKKVSKITTNLESNRVNYLIKSAKLLNNYIEVFLVRLSPGNKVTFLLELYKNNQIINKTLITLPYKNLILIPINFSLSCNGNYNYYLVIRNINNPNNQFKFLLKECFS